MKDAAFGIIAVLRQADSADRVLLVLHRKGHWGFPKGHAEYQEAPPQTACREFEEETGITDYTLLDLPPLTEQYQFVQRGQSIDKTVQYFMATVRSEEVTIQADEIQDYRWATVEEAHQLLTFTSSRDVLQQLQHRMT